MAQPVGDERLAPYALPRAGVGEGRGQHLDRDGTWRQRVDSLVHDRDPAAPDRVQQDVPADDGGAHPQQRHVTGLFRTGRVIYKRQIRGHAFGEGTSEPAAEPAK
ncbi:hypothetical protein Prum_059290 [Phytohabitans rumicis]|uniref:Uncharacterized protein n=1 Tax=Phytohabitans rumicis TaxID=1076125 RepID=A0A6V8LE22_9ACTN|nr:hypothetical protein Prum_059290 [Phytohabitans rumicis]